MREKNFEFENFYYYLKVNSLQKYFLHYKYKLVALQYKLPIEITADYLKPEAKCLDWSCGNGHFAAYLDYKQMQITASSFYDIIPDYLKQSPHFNFTLIDDKEHTKLPFEDKSFDIVFSIGVLEHVHETGGSQEQSLNELHRILDTDGMFFCFHLPNKFSLVENIIKFIPSKMRSFFSLGSPHSKKFSREDVQSLLAKENFELVEYGRYNMFPKNSMLALPKSLVKNCFFTTTIKTFDKLLCLFFPLLCTQSYFIAKKRDCNQIQSNN